MFSGPRYGGLELSHCKEQWTAGFLGGSDSIEFICNVGDLGLSPGWKDPLAFLKEFSSRTKQGLF